jgi:hypothetical protein
MSKGLLICMLMVTLRWVAMAQIPRTLQIGTTNGIVTLSTQTSPGAFFGQLQTTTNLSPPVVWSGTSSAILQAGVNSNFPAAEGSSFFRLLQQWPVFGFAIFYNLNLEIDPGGIGEIVIPSPASRPSHDKFDAPIALDFETRIHLNFNACRLFATMVPVQFLGFSAIGCRCCSGWR